LNPQRFARRFRSATTRSISIGSRIASINARTNSTFVRRRPGRMARPSSWQAGKIISPFYRPLDACVRAGRPSPWLPAHAHLKTGGMTSSSPNFARLGLAFNLLPIGWIGSAMF
jgi:hypothetical protein